MKIGVLALQGDFAEHINIIQRCGYETVEVRLVDQLKNLDGLIIPGGESTTIAHLESAESSFSKTSTTIFDAIRSLINDGLTVWGTCMGSILLAKEIEGSLQGRIGLMDIVVRRNAFGTQRESFSVDLTIPDLGEPDYPAIFIRAPLFMTASGAVEILASYGQGFVMARQRNMLVTAFHPELTNDLRIHEYFLKMVETNVLSQD